MNYRTSFPSRRGLRAYAAAFISYLMFAGQIAPLALGAAAPAPPPPRVESSAPAPAPLSAAPQPAAPLPFAAPVITATKVDAFSDPNSNSKVEPGETITYTVTITNTGDADATGVVFSDNVDGDTTLINSSIDVQPITTNDTYNVISNVRIQPNAAQGLLANDATFGGTASGPTTTTEGGNLTVNADGSFSYNPPAGFTGTDTFTYTVTSTGSQTDTATATLKVGDGNGGTTGPAIWFIDAAAAPGGDGRLTSPFNCFVGAGCFSASTLDEAGDVIFLYDGAYTGGQALLNNQKLVGQDASASLVSIAGVTVPAYSDALPATDGTAGGVNITTTNVTALTLGQNNTLRGFTVGNVGTGAKIAGTNFGTLTAGNNTTPDVSLGGTGKALDLATGAFAATSAFIGVTTTSSTDQGIELAGVSGTVAFGSTTVSNSTSQGVLVGTTTANINFGNTSVTGGTDAIRLENNSSGTRTFGTITTSGNSGAGFTHVTGGGAVTVAGTTTITTPGGTGINVDNSNANLTFAATVVNKAGINGRGVLLSNNATRTITFASLNVHTGNGIPLEATNSGTVNVINAVNSNLDSDQQNQGLIIANTAVDMDFTSIIVTNPHRNSTSTPLRGIDLQSVSGTGINVGTTNVTNSGPGFPSAEGIFIQNCSAPFSFGNTTLSTLQDTGVRLNNNTGNIAFADLDIGPNTGAGLHATDNTGTISSSSGDIAATGAAAVLIDGPGGRTPLSMTLTSVTSTNSSANGLNLTDVSGSFAVNGSGTPTNITNPTGTGITVNNSTATVNFSNTTSVTGSGNSNGDDTGTGVFLTNNSGAVTFGALNVAPDSGERGLYATDTDTGSAAGAINISSGTITTTNDTAVHIQGSGSGSKTPLNVTLTTVNTTGGAAAPNGIFLKWTSDGGAGFVVGSTGSGTCTFANTAGCTGGQITNTSGADNTSNGTGVYLEDVAEVSLTRMRINIHPNFAIRGKTVTNFTLQSSVVDGNNGTCNGNGCENDVQLGEDSIRFNNLLGSGLIDNSFVGGGWTNNIRVVNNTGTLNRLTISNSTIGDLDGAGAQRGLAALGALGSNGQASGGEDSVKFSAAEGIAAMNVTLTNNVINYGIGTLIRVGNNDNAATIGTVDAVVRSNTLVSNTPIAGQVVGANIVQVAGLGHVTYDVSCNKMANSVGIPLLVFKGKEPVSGGQAANFSGTIFNNTVGLNGVAGSGGGPGTAASAINVDQQGTGTGTVLIKNNVSRNHREAGIRINHIDTNNSTGRTSVLNATVIGNTVTQPDFTAPPANAPFANVYVNAGADPVTDVNQTTNLRVGHATVAAEKNNLNDGNATTFDAYIERVAGTLNLSRAGSAGGTGTQVIVDDNITAGAAQVFVTAAAVLVNTTPALPASINESCTPPAVVVTSDGPAAESATAPKGGTPVADTAQAGRALTLEEVHARARRALNNRVTNLVVFGWVIPPADDKKDEEEEEKGEEKQEAQPEAPAAEAAPAPETPAAEAAPPADEAAQPQPEPAQPQPAPAPAAEAKPAAPSAPAVKPDAKPSKRNAGTAFRHTAEDSSAPLVAPEPKAQQRRKVTAPILTDGPSGPNAPGAGGNVNVNIGTLRPGDSVIITFQVTVEDPYDSPDTNISNQGTVSSTTSSFANVLTDDTAAGGTADPTLTPVNVSNVQFRVNDAKAAEPASGSTDMVFTVTLLAPAPGAVSVNFTTNPDTGGANPATSGTDYTPSSGTVSFATGEQVKTINVPVLSDADAPEENETFLVDLSNPVGGTILDGQAVGTITQGEAPGTFLISELRTSGPGGAGDDFVEFYNATDTPHTVMASDGSAGYGIYKKGAADCLASPVLIGTIPNGTVIPARGHFLAVGSQYSLENYGGTDAAAGNLTLTADIETDGNVAVFSTSNPVNVSSLNRLDAVGFGTNTGFTCDLLRESSTLPSAAAVSTTEHTYFRKMCDFVPGSGCSTPGWPKDTNVNSADFLFADTEATSVTNGPPQKLGAPGPENLASPIRRDALAKISASLLDGTKPSSAPPNRFRDGTSGDPNNSNFGTLLIRRRVTNNTGGNVTRLRFRIIEMTTAATLPNQADLRALDSADESVSGIGDTTTCAAETPSATPVCTVTVKGLTLEQPPNQGVLGGGLNSTLSAGSVSLGLPLQDGKSMNVVFKLGVQMTGTFRFLIIVEALP